MILVTGATGFLGRHLVPRLVNAGFEVRALARPGSDAAFLESPGVEFAYADDITDGEAVGRACHGCTALVHAAGRFRFWGDEGAFQDTNVKGTETVLRAAVAAGAERFVYVSTVVVVGETTGIPLIDESAPCRPQEPYQRSKLAAEKRVLSYFEAQQLPAIILRPGAYYGPWGHYAFNRLFFEEPLRGWRIKVNGGRHVTFPVFVPDVAEAILLALEKGRPGEVYNVSGRSLDHNAANAIISDLAGIGRWRLNVPTPAVLTLARAWTFLSRFTHHEPFYPINMQSYVFQDWNVSSEKAERELGFVPTPFEEGAKETLEWYWHHGLLRKR